MYFAKINKEATMQFDNISVVKKANVYFDGKCVSHTVTYLRAGY